LFFFLAAEWEAEVTTKKEIQQLEKSSPGQWLRRGREIDRAATARKHRPFLSQTPDVPAISHQPDWRPAVRQNASSKFWPANWPNEARVEMVRSGGDRQAQTEIAELSRKSTSAICAAIGAQPSAGRFTDSYHLQLVMGLPASCNQRPLNGACGRHGIVGRSAPMSASA